MGDAASGGFIPGLGTQLSVSTPLTVSQTSCCFAPRPCAKECGGLRNSSRRLAWHLGSSPMVDSSVGSQYVFHAVANGLDRGLLAEPSVQAYIRGLC